jgi:DNA-3-methyladenine glycosylase II
MNKAQTFSLNTKEPFSWSECLAFLSRSDKECLFAVEDDAVYKPFSGSKGNILTKIRAGGSALEISIISGNAGDKDIEQIKEYVKDWFDTDTDLAPFYTMASRDKLLKPLVKRYTGLRLIGIPDLFEALSWAVIGQEINLAFAYSLKRRVVETFGESLSYEGRKFYIFPSPHTIAQLKVSDLRPLQFSEKKAEYLIGVAGKFASGELDKKGLMSLDHDEQEKFFTSIRGIGKWSAHYAMMKSLKDRSAFPVADVGIQNAVKALLKMDAKPSEKELLKMAEEWKGWEAYAAFYLWRSLY